MMVADTALATAQGAVWRMYRCLRLLGSLQKQTPDIQHPSRKENCLVDADDTTGETRRHTSFRRCRMLFLRDG